MKQSPARRAAVDGILCALAAALSFLESLLPDAAFMPPGAKLGLSNIAVMFAVFTQGPLDGLLVTAVKSGFAFLTRGMSAGFISLAGGVLSWAALCVFGAALNRRPDARASYVGISVVSAVLHNIGQLAAASVYTGRLLWTYLPALIVFGIISGVVTGLAAGIIMPALRARRR